MDLYKFHINYYIFKISNNLTTVINKINNLGSTKTVNLANKTSGDGVATYTDYVTLPSAGSYVVYCNATMSGTPTSGVSNLGIQVNGVDGTGKIKIITGAYSDILFL